jgi:hypothetical protein
LVIHFIQIKIFRFCFSGFIWLAAGGGTAGIGSVQFLIATTNINQQKLVWSKRLVMQQISGHTCILMEFGMVP